MGLPGVNLSIKEKFDTQLPPNFEEFKKLLIKQINDNNKKEGDE